MTTKRAWRWLPQLTLETHIQALDGLLDGGLARAPSYRGRAFHFLLCVTFLLDNLSHSIDLLSGRISPFLVKVCLEVRVLETGGSKG